ncbi:NAD-glutamate dehydrogenase [Iodidimonas sp. MBR-55]|jgi:glutamate dehydrogenase|uniref:NAD-glutamate dehydrogenase n=2 Tax=unclassified Iodidimonas TaxID=2626145 RepID=UPI00248265A8|nr:NAD-glutamate dehydrogenase [Iodidimonas sp. MBR-55]
MNEMDVNGSNPFEHKDAVIAEVIQIAGKNAPKKERDDFLRFLDVFYAHASPDDVIAQSPETLYAIAFHLWQMSATRKAGQPKIEVFNPRSLKGGWGTAHTAIAIVNDDMPFLVDSITGGLAVTHRYRLHAVHHPIVMMDRDETGKRRKFIGAVSFERGHERGDGRESCMYIEIDAQSDPAVLEDIKRVIETILHDVRASVKDWRAMIAKIDETVASLTVNPPPIDPDDQEETIRFLRWLGADRFTFLGYREYRFDGDATDSDFHAVEKSGLGILRDPNRFILRGTQGLTAISAEIRHFLAQPDKPVIITKANVKATVHRPVHMDYVGVKIYNEEGGVIGERRFTGLFTSQAYAESPYDTPLLRRKVENVQKRALFDKRSHAGKALRHILETFPRDELFQIEEGRLLRTGLGVLHLLERPRPRAFIRRDQFERFVSALVYVPRDVYHSGLRQAVEGILCDAFNGEISVYYAQLSDDVMARWHFIIRTKPGEVPQADEAMIDQRLAEAVKGWPELLREHLVGRHGEEDGIRLYNRYGQIFSVGYQEDFDPNHAVLDIAKIHALRQGEGIGFDLYRRETDRPDALRLKMYHDSEIIPLSECLPMLEHLGLKVISEHAYELEREEGGCIHDFFLLKSGAHLDIKTLKPLVEDLLVHVWTGRVEDDSFNSLAIDCSLTARQIMVLRAYSRFMRQLGLPFGQVYVARCLRDHPQISRDLFDLFAARFDPDDANDDQRDARVASLESRFHEALDQVTGLDEDRILRAFFSLIKASVRTNFYQSLDCDKGSDGSTGLAIKIRSHDVDEAPLPRPWREIFVYSPRVEGVHLRWGPVARGGLRWSDRRQDFRTEVLGLVKAQHVKNAVIVPVGAKGGFVPKNLPTGGDREAILDEGIACYKRFICSLLSITDNLVDGTLTHPDRVLCHDEDDPYLVVAADKGTASFSDIANQIAKERKFWLGDAFASGGSQGYDHKAMAITARGAWVSVERHFRERGLNVDIDPFTVIGVGDMSGDVFGNGMLLSRAIRLRAAFDHRHIFIDPDPEAHADAAFKERQRLFALSRSSWADYDTSLISEGGGVWSRSAKSIRLNPQIKAFLGIDKESLTPTQLIHHILKAKADLLWFGGIGTYVKATEESHADAGDRANDILRINASELRASCVGEGANLGMTQKARIEFARAGGRINTDFIDNSAGVDCSDKEVNIKILLADAMATGTLQPQNRDSLLAEMTDAVATIVLEDNYLQTQALSHAEAQAAGARESHAGLIRTLAREGTLDRDIEFLPSEEQFSELAVTQKGLSRPELSVLMAYAKLSLKAIMTRADLLDDPFLQPELCHGFPDILVERFPKSLENHRLRREMIATILVNQVVNRAGLTFVYEVREETGLGVDQIFSAFLVVRDIFRLQSLWPQVDALDYQVPSTIQTLMHLELTTLIKQQTIWFLRNEDRPLALKPLIETYGDGVAALLAQPEEVLSPLSREAYQTRVAMYQEQGTPLELARRVVSLQMLGFCCDVQKVAMALGRDVVDVGRAFSEVGECIGFDWLRQTSEMISTEDHWDRLAARAVLDDLADQQRELTRYILQNTASDQGSEAVSLWFKEQEMTRMRADRLLADLKSSGPLSVAKLSFAARHLRSIMSRAVGS